MQDLINTLQLKVGENICLHPAKDVIVSVVLRESFLKTLPNGYMIQTKEVQSYYLNLCIYKNKQVVDYIDCNEQQFYNFMNQIKIDPIKTIRSIYKY